MPHTPQHKSDPQVMDAIQRLVQTQLNPLEEVIFQSWLGANQLEEGQNPDQPFDYRGLYKETGGKVFAPGELKGKVDRQSAIDTLMKAQQAHDQQSPIQMLMENGGDPSTLGLQSPDMGAAPSSGGGMMDSMMGGVGGDEGF